MPLVTLGTEVGLGPGDIVLDGYWGPSSPTERGITALPSALFRPCLLRPNDRPSQLLSSCLTGRMQTAFEQSDELTY